MDNIAIAWREPDASRNWETAPNIAASHKVPLSTEVLVEENRIYRRTGGVSRENKERGFLPAFRDETTGTAYLSRFADGRVAPLHVLDGLPSELVTDRDPTGRVRAVKDSVVAGFVRNGQFYTRKQVTVQAATGPFQCWRVSSLG